MLAIKNEDLNYSEHVSRQVDSILRNFVQSCATYLEEQDCCGAAYTINKLDCRRRDGFIPYSHNKGGYELEQPLMSFQVECFGFQKEVEEHYIYLREIAERNMPGADYEALCGSVQEMDEEPLACLYLQAMLTSENGVSIKFGMYFSDAPYFRHETDQDYVQHWDIEFSNPKELKDKLTELEEKIAF